MPLSAGGICLSHDFISGKRDRVHAEVNSSGVLIKKYDKKGVESHIEHKFTDIIGATLVSEEEVEVLSCPFVTKSVLRKAGRRLFALRLRVDSSGSAESKAAIAKAFQVAIVRGSQGLDISQNEAPAPRKFLVFVNPFSGKKQSVKIMDTVVRPMMVAAGVQMEEVVSTSQGFVQQYAKTMDVSDTECIAVLSGDGLLTECLNGIMCRPDWESVVRIPFAPIPTGTGNAISASVLHACKENFGVIESVYVTLKGSVAPFDLMCISTAKRRTYGALTLTWGLLADVDIGSEKFRRLGSTRFAITFVEKMASFKKYPCKLSYLPSDKVEATAEAGDGSFPTENVSDISVGLAYADKPVKQASRKSLRRKSSEVQSEEASAEQDAAKPESPGSSKAPASAAKEEAASMRLPTSGFLPAFDEPVPSSWETLDGPFVGFSAVLPSHIGWDMFMLHNALINDGLLHLVINGPKANRKAMVGAFDALTSGHGRVAEVAEEERYGTHYMAVKAFRLEMDASDSHLCIDGEHIVGGSVQCEVLPELGHIMAMLPEDYGAAASSSQNTEVAETLRGEEVEVPAGEPEQRSSPDANGMEKDAESGQAADPTADVSASAVASTVAASSEAEQTETHVAESSGESAV